MSGTEVAYQVQTRAGNVREVQTAPDLHTGHWQLPSSYRQGEIKYNNPSFGYRAVMRCSYLISGCTTCRCEAY
eukprot:3448291-Rhodomonas_salina.1